MSKTTEFMLGVGGTVLSGLLILFIFDAIQSKMAQNRLAATPTA